MVIICFSCHDGMTVIFESLEKQPKNRFLKILGDAEDIPDDIYIQLHEFEKKYGFIRNKTRMLRKPDRYSAV